MLPLFDLLFMSIVLLLNESYVVESWASANQMISSVRRSKRKGRTFFAGGVNNSGDVSTQDIKKVEDSNENKIYFDISIDGEEIGRMVFNVGSMNKNILSQHTENLMKLCGEDLRPIDPRCSYVKCAFKHSPQFVETMPQYRWAHVLDGRGRNAVGRAADRISDPEGMRSCTHNIYGGVYYGLNYDETEGQGGVVLTVPLVGAYRGSTSFSIVRVGESPQEWRENLLLNSAVLGWLESGIEVLHAMARQTRAPPIVAGSGRL